MCFRLLWVRTFGGERLPHPPSLLHTTRTTQPLRVGCSCTAASRADTALAAATALSFGTRTHTPAGCQAAGTSSPPNSVTKACMQTTEIVQWRRQRQRHQCASLALRQWLQQLTHAAAGARVLRSLAHCHWPPPVRHTCVVPCTCQPVACMWQHAARVSAWLCSAVHSAAACCTCMPYAHTAPYTACRASPCCCTTPAGSMMSWRARLPRRPRLYHTHLLSSW